MAKWAWKDADLTASGRILVSVYCQLKDDAAHLGVRWKGHDIHLTYFERNGVFNCHVTDSRKNPPQVFRREWEIERVIKQLLNDLSKGFICYDPDAFAVPLVDELLEAFAKEDAFSRQKDISLDLDDAMKSFHGLDYSKPTTISELVAKGHDVIAYQDRGRPWILMVGKDGRGYRVPGDLRSGPFAKLPLIVGINWYVEYIHKEGLEEDMGFLKDSDMRQQLKGALLLSLIGPTTSTVKAELERRAEEREARKFPGK